MSRYSIAPEARGEIVNICRYIAADNPAAARRFRAGLFEKFRLLASQPLLGEAREDLDANLRMLTIGNHVILYYPRRTGVDVIQVVHAARDVDALWRRR